MLGGNNNNNNNDNNNNNHNDNNNNGSLFPLFLDENGVPYANTSNQLQLFGNLPVGGNADPVNYFANEQKPPLLRPNKRAREGGNSNTMLRQPKVEISLNYNNNALKDEADRSASIPQNQVSTGLKLSYDDDERNSSVTSASGSMTVAPSMGFTVVDDNIRTVLERQREELERFIIVQEENMIRGVKELTQRQLITIMSALDKGMSQRLRERDQVIENINQKNMALVDRIKQAATEAQNWHYRAKYNESVVQILKNNLQQAIAQAPDQGKEGFGDSEVCNTASSFSNFLNLPGGGGGGGGGGAGPSSSAAAAGGGGGGPLRMCRACNAKESCMLMMPCRHLCLCRDCDGVLNACPICHFVKTASLEVQFP